MAISFSGARASNLGTSKKVPAIAPFCFSKMTAKKHHVTWTDDEVELLLTVANEYNVSKTAENVDWESVQRKYTDILDQIKAELEKLLSFG